MPDLSRRSLLGGLCRLCGVGGLGAATLGVSLTGRPARAEPLGVPGVQTGSFVFDARGGVRTGWAIARPAGNHPPLRPPIALHGKGSDAATVMAGGGVQRILSQAIGAGLPPSAVAALTLSGGRRARCVRRRSRLRRQQCAWVPGAELSWLAPLLTA